MVAIILVSGKSGVTVGTEKSWGYAKEQGIPKMLFVSKMDDENADFFKVYSQLVKVFGKSVSAFQLPIIEEEKFKGFVDIINMKAKKFDKDKLIDADIPAGLVDMISEIRDALNEVIAETDEVLMEKFFAGEEFTHEEIKKGVSMAISDGSLTPVFLGSASNNQGIQTLMDSLIEYMPAPNYKPTFKAKKFGSDEEIELKVTPEESLSALVFKTIADPFVGKISIFRVYSGTFKSDSTVFNTNTEKSEKTAQVFMLRGKKQLPTDKVIAGDIGAVAKLQFTNTNDTLCGPTKQVVLDKIDFPEPALSLAVEPKAKGDEEKIGSGLSRLQDEDPTFKVSLNTETHQTIISGVGETAS